MTVSVELVMWMYDQEQWIKYMSNPDNKRLHNCVKTLSEIVKKSIKHVQIVYIRKVRLTKMFSQENLLQNKPNMVNFKHTCCKMLTKGNLLQMSAEITLV